MAAEHLNVFISSLSKKVPLVKAVRKALEKRGKGGKIIGGDSDKDCIGKYFVDSFWHMPPLSQITPESLISYFRENQILSVIPTRDGELNFYSSLKKLLADEGIHVMVSGLEPVAISTNKLLFYQTLLKMGFLTVETAVSLHELKGGSFVVKEQYGAGAGTIGLNVSKKQAEEFAQRMQQPIFQPYIAGEEVSLDLYLDRYHSTKGAIVRRRDLIVGGESQITTSFQERAVEEMCTGLAEKLELSGHVMFQLIKSEESGTYYILECNPRFGGASTLSLEMGLESFYWFFLESQGEDLSHYHFHRSSVEKKQVRFPEDMIIS